LLLGTDNKGRTAWHLAAEKGNLEVRQKLWEWVQENLTTEVMKNNFFISHRQ